MNGNRKLISRYIAGLVAGCLLILSMNYLGFFEGMNSYCHDLFFRLRGSQQPDRRILVVAIDQASLTRLGRWPLARGNYTRLLDRLSNARAVGLDILMSEPSDDDRDLSAAIGRHGRVVLPVAIGNAVFPFAGPTARAVGHVHLERDIDGVARKVYHTLYYDSRAFYSFSSRSLETAFAEPFPRQTPPVNRQADQVSPIFQLDGRHINYCGVPGTFPQVSMADVLAGNFPLSFFKDKIVLVGYTAEGLDGGVLTPFSQTRSLMSGVEVHATILDNLIKGNSLRETPELAEIFISLAIALTGLALFFKVNGRQLLLCWLAGLFAVTALSFVLLCLARLWCSPVLLCMLLSFMAVYAYIIKLEQSRDRLREAEREWEETFDTIADGIVLTNPDGAVARMNDAASPMQAVRLLELAEYGLQRDQTVPDGDYPLVRLLQDPETGNHFEIRTLERRKDHDGPRGYVHVVRDITSAVHSEQEKEQLQHQFLQSQKMESIGRLAGGVAHDFNNILTIISGYCEMALARVSGDSKLTDPLNIIHDAAGKAAMVVRQLLAFSRKNRAELQPVSLKVIVENMAKIYQRVIGEDIRLSVAIDGTDGVISADPGLIEQVIMNLVVNARDAMPSGGALGITIREVKSDSVECRRFSRIEPGTYVLMEVRDSGVGMSPEVQERIFEPFFTTKQIGKGTGLGLSTVYGIVKQLSGEITVTSEPGRGAVFTMLFPVSAVRREAGKPGKEPDCLVGGNETILVAEDDGAILDLITHTLKSLGYNVYAAVDGYDALQVAAGLECAVDLLLTDVVMPGMGGKELAEIIHKKFPEAQVLFMSGFPDETLAARGINQEQNLVIRKPLSSIILSATIRRLLDGKR